jgi:hypothetical protein
MGSDKARLASHPFPPSLPNTNGQHINTITTEQQQMIG